MREIEYRGKADNEWVHGYFIQALDIYNKPIKTCIIKNMSSIRPLDGMVKQDYYEVDPKKISWKDLPTIQKSLRIFAENECEFDKGLIHPHMFRHFFAKNFIMKYQNIALLADLLGHSNIDTTRIYLKYTSKEQQEIVNQVVRW